MLTSLFVTEGTVLLERIGLECEGYVRMLCTCTAHRQAIKGLYFYLFFFFANVSKNIHSVGVYA